MSSLGIYKLRPEPNSDGYFSSVFQAWEFKSLDPTSFPLKANEEKLLINIIFFRFKVNQKPVYFILIHFEPNYFCIIHYTFVWIQAVWIHSKLKSYASKQILEKAFEFNNQ